MRQHDASNAQRGLAALEMAIGILFLLPLFMVLVEGTGALRQYALLQNAAMEGARMVARQAGDVSGVTSYVAALLEDTPVSSPTVTISDRDAQNNVTVQVAHVFMPFFLAQASARSQSNPNGLLDTDSLRLSAQVTMALAEAN